jgi:hypothetical protein
MNKRIITFIVIFAIILTALPAMAVNANSSAAPVSGDLFTEKLTTDLAGVKFETSFNMVFVEGGTFTLGWQAADSSLRPADVAPVRNVTVSDFYIGETEVTVALWNAVMGQNAPSGNANKPKEQVNFYQVQEFLSRLYVLTGRTYRLATEAEWEFAAKGGNPGFSGNKDYPGNNQEYLFSGSNNHNEVVASRTSVADVKTAKPNILGIYDMSGNAEEWVYNTWNSAHTGGVDPIGPGGNIHQQKTRRGGTYGTNSADSTRTLAARQIRSIDGGAGMGFRIALSGDMNTVPPGMIRPRDIEHPNIDERTIPVTYRDTRWITNDNYKWSGSFAGTMSFTMKLWETGEMVIQTPGFADRIGQWYSVSNLGIIFVENAGQETEKRMTLPYVFMTETYVTVINDVSFTGDGAPIGRFEKVPDTGTAIAKPEGLTLYDPAELASASEHDHTSYDLSNITMEMRGQDPRLLDGPDSGWWQTGGGGIHQYRKDFTPDSFRFVVYSPAFGSGTGGANKGYGANYLAQATSWYTVNDMLLVVGSGSNVQHYLYTVTDELNSINVPGVKTKQLMHISYMDYEKGDQRIFELHSNKVVKGYSQDIPNGYAFSIGKSTFRAAPAAETVCPGGCGEVISACKCPTICQKCNSHVNNCYCNDAEERLDASTKAAQNALQAYNALNSTTQAHIDALLRTNVGFHAIERTWTSFDKINATYEKPGSITGTVILSLGGHSKTLNVDIEIGQLPKLSAAGWSITPHATIGSETVTMTATDLEKTYTNFDIGGLFNMAGKLGYTYALWFGDEGTFSFDKDITLTKGYFDASFAEIGRDKVLIPAGKVICVADGVYSEYQKKTVPWSEFSVTLDDGNSWMIIYKAEPGNYATLTPDVPLKEFPGSVAPPYTVLLSSQSLKVNGVNKSLEIYNINGNNYFKLRDVAYLLNGTASQFSVTFDAGKKAISCVKGEAYDPVGGEVKLGSDKSETVVPSSQSLYIDGALVSLSPFNIGGNNFFKLRDLGIALNFNVDYDDTTRTMLITSIS